MTGRPELGVGQWFHYEAHRDVERAVRLLEELGVVHLRTGISWADFHRARGPAWVDFLMDALSGFELLVSVWHTPPSLAEGGRCAGPPRRLQDYADFVDQILTRHRPRIAALELWNEPNNRLKWDFERHDPDWAKFAAMVGMAGHWAQRAGVRTVLGGMIPVDPAWLDAMGARGVLGVVDAVGIHAFPEMWWDDAPNWEWHRDWHGWARKVAAIAPHARARPIWVTETGLATWDMARGRPGRHGLQADALERAASAPVQRLYWYSLEDLDPARAAIEGFHVDENEYHMGLVAWDGTRKPAWDRMKALLRERARAATRATDAAPRHA